MSPSAPLLALQGISKRFGALQALDDVSLEVARGEIHCLLGENGAGKSTLCNAIFGVIDTDAGQMHLDGAAYRPASPADALAAGVAMVHQHFSLVREFTVVDTMLLGQASGWLDREACAARIADLATQYGLALDPHARIGDLSVGERQRVEIAKCLMRRPRLLVLDEPTAVLLPDEIDALLSVCERVAAEGCAVVLVTHKLAEIRRSAHRATVLRTGRVVATSPRPGDEIDRLVQAMIGRDTLAPLASRRAPAPPSSPVVAPDAGDRRNEVFQIDGLRYRDEQGVDRVRNATLVIRRGEIVGIAGVEGNGQSELAAMLAGMLRPTDGRFYAGDVDLTRKAPADITAAGVGVVPEDRHATGCVTGMSLAENLFLNRMREFAQRGLIDRAAMRHATEALMARFDVRAASPDIAFGALSGGNQQKAVLARELTLDPLIFLLAANPTRGLDVGAVEAVYTQIRAACERGIGVLLISSELDELIAVADRIVVMYRGAFVGECRADPSERDRIGALMAGHA